MIQPIYAAQIKVASNCWDMNLIKDEKFVEIVISTFKEAKMSKHAHALKWMLQTPTDGETTEDLACVLSAMIDADTFENGILDLYTDELERYNKELRIEACNAVFNF